MRRKERHAELFSEYLELHGTLLRSMSDRTPGKWSDCMKTIKNGSLWTETRSSLGEHAITVRGAVPVHLTRAARGETLIKRPLWVRTRFDRAFSCECRPANHSGSRQWP